MYEIIEINKTLIWNEKHTEWTFIFVYKYDSLKSTKKDPVAGQYKGGDSINREKVIKFVNRCLEKADDPKLRVIAMVCYHITK